MVRIPSVGNGVVKDVPAEELPLGAWSDVSNVMFRDGVMTRALGMPTIYEPGFVPYWLSAFRTSTARYMMVFGTAAIYAHNGSTATDVSKSGGYTGGASNRWTGGVLSGIFVASNYADKPQYWAGSTSSDFADLTNWPSTKKCKFIRPFKYFLVAGYIDTSGTVTPYRVMWSDAADPGSLPSTWVAAGTNEAGEQDLPDSGPLVDACVLGDQMIVYSTNGAFSMRYVGGNDANQNMAFAPIACPGLLTQNCVADTPLGHVCLGPSDVYLLNSQGAKSICDGTVRQDIFTAIDGDNSERAAFVIANPAAAEVWVCYPTGGAATCTKAAVWNWATGAWTFRTLRNVTAGASGQLPSIARYTVDGVPGVFGDSLDLKFPIADNPNTPRVVFGHASQKVSMLGVDYDDIGLPVTSTATRTGIHLDQPDVMKLCRGVWPRITGTAGTEISIQIGASDVPGGTPTYQTAVTYTIGTSQKVDSFASGRYLAVKITSTASDRWKLRGMDLDIQPLGRF